MLTHLTLLPLDLSNNTRMDLISSFEVRVREHVPIHNSIENILIFLLLISYIYYFLLKLFYYGYLSVYGYVLWTVLWQFLVVLLFLYEWKMWEHILFFSLWYIWLDFYEKFGNFSDSGSSFMVLASLLENNYCNSGSSFMVLASLLENNFFYCFFFLSYLDFINWY